MVNRASPTDKRIKPPPFLFRNPPVYSLSPMIKLTRMQCVLVLLLAQCAIYLQSVGFPWIHLDDYKHIFENPLIIEPSFQNLLQFWKGPYFTLYIPVTYTAWFLIGLISHSSWIFHLSNILLHCGNSVLVFLLFEQLLSTDIRKNPNNVMAAFLGSLIFSLHPIQVESVVWISGMKDCLFAFLVLLSAYLYTLKLREQMRFPDAWLVLLTLAAVLSKPTAVILPFLLVALRWYLLKEPLKKSFFALIPVFFTVIPIAVITKMVQPDFQVKDLAPLWFRPVVTLHALGFYLKQVLLPYYFVLDYGKSPTGVRTGFMREMIFPVLTLLAGYFFYRIRKNRLAVLACAFVLLPILPCSGLIPFQFQLFSTVTDRYFYLSMAGVGLACAGIYVHPAGSAWPAAVQFAKRPEWAIAMTLIVFGLVSFKQVSYWRTNEILFEHTLNRNPHSLIALNNLAYVDSISGRHQRAAQHLKTVTLLKTDEPELFMNYASALVHSNRHQDAIDVLNGVIKKFPNHTHAQRTLALLQSSEQPKR